METFLAGEEMRSKNKASYNAIPLPCGVEA
jgi:hypothetical protein